MGTLIEGLKTLAALVVSFGVGAVAENLIGLAAKKETSKLIKASMWIGGLVIAGLASAAAEKKVDETIDGALVLVDKYLVKPDEDAEENEDQKEEETEVYDDESASYEEGDGEEA